jgi:biopolymer transport protein TolQ
MRYCARRVLFWLFCALVWSAAVPSPGALTSQSVAMAAGTEPNVATMEPAPNLQAANAAQVVTEADTGSTSIFGRALQGGFIVFVCLLILLSMSVVTWAVIVAKYVYLQRLAKSGESFTKSFWDSRSLNDLNSRLAEYPYSPVREVFRSGYAELVRGSQLLGQVASQEIAINAALDNINRALAKAKLFERRRLEKFMSLLAISASACPFIGLFGTVWGIMGAFEGIAKTGSASLAAVAPGISEALVSTAFGLAAAIPAVVGYNMFAARVRYLVGSIDGFTADFLNIVERYLVSDKPRAINNPPTAGSQSPLDSRI